MSKFTIAVDIMGGDNAPFDTVKGVVGAVCENKNLNIIAVGKKDIIEKELLKYTYDKGQISIQNATEIIENCDMPTVAIKEKKNSSMVVGLKLLKEDKAGAFISAGSTGALLTGGATIIKRVQGVKRPALGTLIPNAKGSYTFLIDSGANMDCKPIYLQNFAKMGKVYMENMLNIKYPKIGLINVGSEEGKGDIFAKESYELLKNTSGINFIGNVEGRDIASGEVDVVVCDGFVGNVTLKVCEGIARTFSTIVKEEIKSNALYFLGGAICKGAFNNVKKRLDYSEVGGAPFLGLKALVVKAHGSSNDIAIKNAIAQGYTFIKENMTEKMKESFKESD